MFVLLGVADLDRRQQRVRLPDYGGPIACNSTPTDRAKLVVWIVSRDVQ